MAATHRVSILVFLAALAFRAAPSAELTAE